MADVADEVDRRTEDGVVHSLVRRGAEWHIVIDGQLAMRSGQPRADREVVDLALAPWETRDDLTVLLAGLGMGLTLRALLDRSQVQRVDVVERSQTVVDWCGQSLAELNGGALADKRVHLSVVELGDFLRAQREADAERRGAWFVVILDTDVWPVALTRPENVEFYHEDFLVILETALRPGGVLALLSARRDDELERRLRVRFQSVVRIGVPVEVEGDSRVYYVYRGRRSSVGGGDG